MIKKLRHITDVRYDRWEDLTKERQTLEFQKAIDDNRFYDIFAGDIWRQYQGDLNNLQEKYKLDVKPFVYRNGHFEMYIKSKDTFDMIEKNLNLFMSEFFEMYKHYKDLFEYGNREEYDTFVKDMLMAEEFETVIDKKMIPIYDKRYYKKEN